ncbi:class F sortase [Allobranchiibius sp. GilTou38]|nr:class F sortase [Allobranchiibius sp. GilTou38]
MMLAVIAVGLIGRYLTMSPAPPAAGDLGTIPAAMARPAQQAVTIPAAPATKAAGKKPANSSAAPSAFHLSASAPVSIRVPSVGIRSHLLTVGLNANQTIEVPTTAAEAAWYRLGPTPGALGPAVILGHVDSTSGPGVFYKLGALRPGQRIEVTRADGSLAYFRVDAVDSYLKDQFPSQAVYGPIDYAGLRLITCGGRFNTTTHHYESNTVVFASLTRS